MAASAGFHFRVSSKWLGTFCNRIAILERPKTTRVISQPEHEPMVRSCLVAAVLRPRDVPRGRAMARLACHAHIAPPGVETARVGVIVLLEIGGMTFRTLVIPVLRRVSPVQHIAMIDL